MNFGDRKIPGSFDSLNNELDKAGRVIDFIELGDLMIRDALTEKSPVEVIFEKKVKLKQEKQKE